MAATTSPNNLRKKAALSSNLANIIFNLDSVFSCKHYPLWWDLPPLTTEMCFNLSGSCSIQTFCLRLWLCSSGCLCGGQWKLSTCTVVCLNRGRLLRGTAAVVFKRNKKEERESGEEKQKRLWGGECLKSHHECEESRQEEGKCCFENECATSTVELTRPRGGGDSKGIGWQRLNYQQELW